MKNESALGGGTSWAVLSRFWARWPDILATALPSCWSLWTLIMPHNSTIIVRLTSPLPCWHGWCGGWWVCDLIFSLQMSVWLTRLFVRSVCRTSCSRHNLRRMTRDGSGWLTGPGVSTIGSRDNKKTYILTMNQTFHMKITNILLILLLIFYFNFFLTTVTYIFLTIFCIAASEQYFRFQALKQTFSFNHVMSNWNTTWHTRSFSHTHPCCVFFQESHCSLYVLTLRQCWSHQKCAPHLVRAHTQGSTQLPQTRPFHTNAYKLCCRIGNKLMEAVPKFLPSLTSFSLSLMHIF